MADVSAPFGLRSVGKLDQGEIEPIRQYPIASGYNTAIAAGDVVQLVNDGGNIVIQKQSATGDTATAIDMVGVFVGCEYTDPNLNYTLHSSQWPAGTVTADAVAYVVDDPDVLFEIQADGAPASTNAVFGQNAPMVQTAPNTTLGVSRVALDVSGVGTDAELPLRIIDYRGGSRGDEAGSLFPVLLCKFNYHQHSSTTGSS